MSDDGEIIIPEDVTRGPGGRKPILEPDERTLRQIKSLAAMQCTQEEAAASLGVSTRTFKYFIGKHEEVRAAWEDGREVGKVSVRRAQFKMAQEVPQMAIWWGKQHLGQADKSENVNTTVDITPEERVKRVVELQKRVAERKAPAAPAIPQIGKAGTGGDR